ncbi:MAG: recombinase family protein [Phycisphaeraceae bacterium]|nr:recombinase family protein [Phycisphaeraceae bacterium]
MSGRRRKQTAGTAEPKASIRCAIYTRKSSDEGLDQEFNSLDAQRESAEAFIASQKAEGWTCVADRYDDGGFSGGSMERPALDRLLRDIEAGKVDCVVVYKVDRLSRSLMDFARIMEAFDRKGVSFVSVTQQFNTTSSMGRLTLNILLSFAQFEREIIGERIRDKIAAQKRRGKWAGGTPVLGYDVDRSGPSPRLAVNTSEALRVRQIFEMYLDKGSLLPVVSELARRQWPNKRRVTKKGQTLGGRPFNKATLYQTLTNPIYVGKIVHKSTAYDGEHESIVSTDIFDRVQALLKLNGRSGSVEVRNKYGALLRGLLRCKCCGYSMTHTFTGGRKNRSYRYYRCVKAIKSGSGVCPSGTLPAAEIERVVVDEVRSLATDRALLTRVLADAQSMMAAELEGLTAEHNTLRSEIARHHRALQELAVNGSASAETTARIADLHERIADAQRRLPPLDARIAEVGHNSISRDEAEAAFADFDELWRNLIPREQARLLKLLISTVDYDAKSASIAVTFRPTGIRSLIARRLEEAA